MNSNTFLAVTAALAAATAVAGAFDAAMAQAHCKQGFVWREAARSDFVCVPPEDRAAARSQNSKAANRRETNPALMHAGPHTCRSGFVWRDAFNGDTVCVTPNDRERAKTQNRLHGVRVAGGGTLMDDSQ